MFKKKQLDLAIAITTFLVLISLIIYIYTLSLNRYYAVIEEDLLHTGNLITKEFKDILKSDISELENIKRRLEFTNGNYFEYWEQDADFLTQQNTSFKFIEWIDSLMVIRKINPLKGNEQAIGLDISKMDSRRDEWISHSKNGKTNITSWFNLTQSGNSFLVDVPVYFDNKFQGTITGGMDFNDNFDRLINYFEDQYAIEIFDDRDNLFFEENNSIRLKSRRNIIYTNTITVDESDGQLWRLNVYPSEKLLISESKIFIYFALIVGVFLAFILSSLIFFYLRAKQEKKQAIEVNATLKKLNKRLKNEKDRANKASQAKTDFLSNMSHEIRTPLHAIIGLIEVLKDEELKNTQKEYVDLMDKSSNNLLNIVNDILEIDKIESGKTELDEHVFNPIKEIKELAEVNEFLFIKKKLYLKTNFENAIDVSVIGDANKLVQILNNILKNALKFTKEGGVTITCSGTVVENKLQLTVSIEDTGIGIAKKELDSIFKRFTQIENSIKKQYEGSGLGLAICQDLVSIIGGKISVESEYRKGSKFTVSFLFNITEAENDLYEHKKSINIANINVLIVDDNNLNVIILKKFLSDIGITSDIAENGKIALEKVKEKNYQLIFMDIHMPEMDGWEATRIIRQTDKNVVIFGLSANVTTEAINKAIENGMNNYLTKPFKKQHLYKLLRFHFNN